MGEKKISYDYMELGAGLVKFMLAPLFFKKARIGKENNRDDPWDARSGYLPAGRSFRARLETPALANGSDFIANSYFQYIFYESEI